MIFTGAIDRERSEGYTFYQFVILTSLPPKLFHRCSFSLFGQTGNSISDPLGEAKLNGLNGEGT